MRVHLTQAQCQFRTVVDGDGVGIQFSRFFRQRGTAIAVQIQAVCRHCTAVANIQGRGVGQGDGIRQQARVFNIDLRLVIHCQRVDVRQFAGIPL